jgi:hypothetical protein
LEYDLEETRKQGDPKTVRQFSSSGSLKCSRDQLQALPGAPTCFPPNPETETSEWAESEWERWPTLNAFSAFPALATFACGAVRLSFFQLALVAMLRTA